MLYTVERVISDNPRFLVLEVKDERGHSEVAYINCEFDMTKQYYTEKELRMV